MSDKPDDGKRNIVVLAKERGEFVTLEDGFYYYGPSNNSGVIAAHHLREIADELDQLNKIWEETIQKELGPPSKHITFHYDPICGALTCDTHIEGITQILPKNSGYYSKFFIGETISKSAAIFIATAILKSQAGPEAELELLEG